MLNAKVTDSGACGDLNTEEAQPPLFGSVPGYVRGQFDE